MKVLCKGLCSKCYYRVKRGGTPELSKKQQMALRKCSFEDCEEPHHSKDLCSTHYMSDKRSKNPDLRAKEVETTRLWKLNNKELHAAQLSRQHVKYKDRDKAYRAKWKKDNKITYNAYLASRKARVRAATPGWADLDAIRDFYFNCPSGHQVDHIIPLNGKSVSGLHVLENLQYLTIAENLKKSNKF